jgi:hypothetical protein
VRVIALLDQTPKNFSLDRPVRLHQLLRCSEIAAAAQQGAQLGRPRTPAELKERNAC